MNQIFKSAPILILIGALAIVIASDYRKFFPRSVVNEGDRIYHCDWPIEKPYFFGKPSKGLVIVLKDNKATIIVDDSFNSPSRMTLEPHDRNIFKNSAPLMKTTFDSSSGIVVNEDFFGGVLTHRCKQVTAAKIADN